MWTDNDTDRDFLNFSGVAQTVAEIIIQAKQKPVSIGVSGSWGVGKSSMIRLIRRSLTGKTTEEQKIIFVEFNAWLYQGYDDARAALMEVIAEALAKQAEESQTAVEKVGDLLKRLNWLRIAKMTFGTVASLAAGLPPVGLIGDVAGVAVDALTKDVQATTISRAETNAAQVAKLADGMVTPKKIVSPPQQIHEIRKGFEEVLKELNVTLVVLIDDLDRCLPETTISTLEAIRLFLFLDHTAFVIAADNEMIKYAVKKHFEGMSDKDLITNYFDKLIQIPIRVPPLGTQEVRAYMMLLFLEDEALEPVKRERIRGKVCKQLGESWQGKRVDRVFLESLKENLTPEVMAKFDLAEQLAHIMVSNQKIAGNPRLIKRFLNAISVRKSIAKANGIAINERALTKLLLFERCGSDQAYSDLLAKVSPEADGKPKFLADWESAAINGAEFRLPDIWDGEFTRQWLALSPALADIDLRGILYVSREHASIITPEDKLSSDASGLLEALLTTPDTALDHLDRLKPLSRAEKSIMMLRILERAKPAQAWGTPPILNACMALAKAEPELGSHIYAFLKDRPSGQIQASLIPKIRDEAWAASLFQNWTADGEISAPVKAAIKELNKAKKV